MRVVDHAARDLHRAPHREAAVDLGIDL